MVTSASGAALASNIATMVTTSGVVVVNNGPKVTITNGAPSSSGTATNANSCYCPTGSPTSWAWGSAVICGNACTGGGLAGKFVTVTASFNFTPLFLSYGFVIGSRCDDGCNAHPRVEGASNIDSAGEHDEEHRGE
jgi:hypothetical protein